MWNGVYTGAREKKLQTSRDIDRAKCQFTQGGELQNGDLESEPCVLSSTDKRTPANKKKKKIADHITHLHVY